MLRESLSSARVRWIVIGPFLAVVTLLAGLGVFTVDILSSVRAYVGGESLWSKGEKDAVYFLGRYTASHNPRDYLAFQQALAVPLGDRRARIELDRSEPDLAVVRQALADGGNHVDDVDGMIRLFRRFRRVNFMAQAIDIWAQADEQIFALAQLGERVHEGLRAGESDSPQLRSLIAQLPPLNAQLTAQGERFSATLGEASRQTRSLVLMASLLLVVLAAAGGVALTLYLLRQQARDQRALQDSNERWALAAEAAGIGVFDWDLAPDRVALDARAAALYGLPGVPAHVAGSHLSRESVHPEDAARLRSALREVIVHPAPLTIRYRVVGGARGTKPGNDDPVRHLELHARARPGESGMRMVGILWDVSDEVRAAQLALDKQTAERANRAKGEFLSRVSHELRTPLNAVLGFTELLQTDLAEPPTESQSQRLQRVFDNGRHLLALINDILDLSSLEDTEAPLVDQPVLLAQVLMQSLSKTEPMARAREVSVNWQPLAEDWVVQADARRLGQVFNGLLSNAVKYNGVGGEVQVECIKEETPDGQRVVVTVRDTGAGLSAVQLAQLFQPFNRLGAEFTRVQGSGLGLVIARQLMARMGGSLDVSSVVGQGTSAVVRLRAAAMPPGQPVSNGSVAAALR